MANYLEFTPNVSWAKVRVGYEESYDKATKTTTLTITSIEVMSTQYKAEYYVDGILNVNGTAVLTSKSSSGNVVVDVDKTNTWYAIEKDGNPFTASVEITDGDTATIELVGNNFVRFAFYTLDQQNGNGWGVTGSQTIELAVERVDKQHSFWLGVALGLAGKGLPPIKTAEPVAYLYNGVELPKLPEWDKEKYPYAAIIFHTDSKSYLLTASQYRMFPEKSSTYGTVISFSYSNKNRIQSVLNFGEDSWGEVKEYSTNSNIPIDADYGYQLIWSNCDLLNDDGTVYFSGSGTNDTEAPVPPTEYVYPDRTASAWDFNGIELPVPPEFDTDVYPYAYLIAGNVYGGTGSGYSLLAGRKPQNGRNMFKPTQLFYYTEKDGWVDRGTDNGLSIIRPPIWVNYDFYDENWELYMGERDIIPIYE